MSVWEKVELFLQDRWEDLDWMLDGYGFNFFLRRFVFWVGVLILGLWFWAVVLSFFATNVHAATASYYTVESCLKESGQFTMANGRKLNDSKFTCASWDYKFGTRLLVTTSSGRSVIVVVTDRGPAKRLCRMGRTLDLSKASFLALADLKRGVIEVSVEVIK